MFRVYGSGLRVINLKTMLPIFSSYQTYVGLKEEYDSGLANYLYNGARCLVDFLV